MNTITQLGELYLESLSDNAYHRGALGTLVEAITAAAGCGGNPDGPDLMRAATQLTRDAMGYLNRCVGGITGGIAGTQFDWYRIDQFWVTSTDIASHPEGDYAPNGTEAEVEAAQAEAAWVRTQLNSAGKATWAAFRCHQQSDWAVDLALAAVYLGAATELVGRAFGLDPEVA